MKEEIISIFEGYINGCYVDNENVYFLSIKLIESLEKAYDKEITDKDSTHKIMNFICGLLEFNLLTDVENTIDRYSKEYKNINLINLFGNMICSDRDVLSIIKLVGE